MTSEKQETLGEVIKKAIKERGLKESFIAQKMEVSKQTINQINLRKTFDIEWLQKFKAASGLDFTEYAYPSAIKIDTPYNVPDLPINHLEESKEDFSKKIEISLNIKLSTDESQLAKISELIVHLKKEASKMGFQMG
jgi:transcriptional regulator with XRE-family HTH domain